MTFEQFTQSELGYTCQTTFWMDFSIADRFGISAVKDTYKRAFKEWKSNVVYLTELVLVLNYKIHQYYQRNEQLARVYDQLWREADQWACDTLQGEDLNYFYQILD